MAKKKTKPEKKVKGGAAVAAAPERSAQDAEKPPESAEDFEHTLRRLIAAKNRG